MDSTVCGGGTSSCVCVKQQSEGRRDSVHMHQSVLQRKSMSKHVESLRVTQQPAEKQTVGQQSDAVTIH